MNYRRNKKINNDEVNNYKTKNYSKTKSKREERWKQKRQ